MTKYVVLMLSMMLITACDGGDGTDYNTQFMYEQDLKALEKIGSRGPKTLNNELDNLFTKVFGGETGQDVLNFLNLRVKQVYAWEHIKDFPITLSENGKLYTMTLRADEPQSSDNGKTRRAALNVGIGLWLLTKTSRLDWLRIQTPTGILRVDSARNGLVGLDAAYFVVPRNPINQGQMNPLEGRLMFMVHEARHSDCTGGLNNGRACGHLHTHCPFGHPLSGESVCDDESWGAYAIGGIFAAGMMYNYQSGTTERRLLEAMAVDAFSRLTKQALDGIKTSEPDLSSQDY